MVGEEFSGDESNKIMREYSRVDAFIPFQVRLVPLEERAVLRSRRSDEMASLHLQPLPDLEDTVLYECLKVINSKLDAILDLLTTQKKDMFALQPSHVNISGSGMSFETNERFSIGDVIEIRLILPTSGEDVFYIYGEVIKFEGKCADRFIAFIRFTTIDEDIRDQIVKFVFEKQREDLRKKKRE